MKEKVLSLKDLKYLIGHRKDRVEVLAGVLGVSVKEMRSLLVKYFNSVTDFRSYEPGGSRQSGVFGEVVEPDVSDFDLGDAVELEGLGETIFYLLINKDGTLFGKYDSYEEALGSCDEFLSEGKDDLALVDFVDADNVVRIFPLLVNARLGKCMKVIKDEED